MKFSLRTALTSLWALILVLCLALAFLMYSLFAQGAGAQLRQGRERLGLAADDAAHRYDRYRQSFDGHPVPLDDPQTRADLEAMLSVAFSAQPGVEGGFCAGSTTRWPTLFRPTMAPGRRRICRRRNSARSSKRSTTAPRPMLPLIAGITVTRSPCCSARLLCLDRRGN